MRRAYSRSRSLEQLTSQLVPDRTVLFLGAGASVPSGAPTGAQLSSILVDTLASGDMVAGDLMETCSILENRYGRDALVGAVREALVSLQPSGGLLSLPQFDWQSIYTTNFDRLVELAYQRGRKEIIPVASNFDYGRVETADGTPLFKIHGSIEQDGVDGRPANLVLTERDYDDYRGFREVLFRRLELDLQTKDILVIGFSLKDQHLSQQMKQAAELQRSRGASGRLFALIYEEDPDRADLMEQRGFGVAFGGIDQFVHKLSESTPTSAPVVYTSSDATTLSARVGTATIEVQHAQQLQPDAVRLYNGSPGTYADIAGNLTFRRSQEAPLAEALLKDDKRFITITGAAGVGKTTLARRLLLSLVEQGFECWEHKSALQNLTRGS